MKKISILFFILLFVIGFSQKTAKQTFNTKKFYNEEIYLKDLEGAIGNGIIDYTRSEVECIGYYIGRMKATDKLHELRKYNYEEIYWLSEAECEIRNSISKNEFSIPEKQATLDKGSSEDYQYLQIHFSKTKKGYVFNELPEVMKAKIEKDFEKDRPGNYTAFYDVFYENDQPKIIKLKSRLNR